MKTKLLFVLSCLFFLNLRSQDYLKFTAGDASSTFISDGWATIDFGSFQNNILLKTTNLSTSQVYYGDSLGNLGYGGYYVVAVNAVNIGDTVGVGVFFIDDQSSNFLYNGNFRVDSLMMNTPSGCDGRIYFSVAGDFMTSYPAAVVKIDNVRRANMVANTAWADSLCMGPHIVQLIDTTNSNTMSFTTFYLGPWPLSVPAYNPQVVTSPVSAIGVCDGTGYAIVNGGTAPFVYSWDGMGFSATDSVSALCTGMHNLTVIDANADTVEVYFVISDSSNVITNPNPFGSPALGTIVFNTSNCSFDYNLPVDSAVITLYTVIDTNTVFISWDIWQNGVLTQVSDTVSYTYSGVNAVQLDLFCGNGRMMTPGFNSIDVIDYINTSGPSGIAGPAVRNEAGAKLYPNPFAGELFAEYYAEGYPLSITITDVLGKTVYRNTVETVKGWNKIAIDGSNFDKGAYCVIFNSNGKVSIKKAVR